MSRDSSEADQGAKLRLKNKRNRDGFGHPLLVIVSLIFIFISSQVLAAVITQIILSVSGREIDIFQSTTAQFLFILIAEALAVWAVFWLLRRRGLGFSSIGLGRRPRWGDLGSALLVFLVFYILLAVLFALLVALAPDIKPKLDEPQQIGFTSINSIIDKLMAFTALVILAPIGEEIMVRGYLFSGLRRHWHFLPSAIVTGLVFGAAHLQPENPGALVWGAALSTFILSFALVYLREKTGALYASILVHSLNNAIAFTVYFTAAGF